MPKKKHTKNKYSNVVSDVVAAPKTAKNPVAVKTVLAIPKPDPNNPLYREYVAKLVTGKLDDFETGWEDVPDAAKWVHDNRKAEDEHRNIR